MRHPKRIEIAAGSVLNLIRAVVEYPFTEPLIDLFGRFEDGTVHVVNVYNWVTADRQSGQVDYGNMKAKERMGAFEETLQLHRTGKRTYVGRSRRIGQAHTHPTYPLEPSRGDFREIRERMEEYNYRQWLEIIMSGRLVEPDGLGIRYVRNGKSPRVEISHQYRNFGLHVTFSGHYIYQSGSRLRRQELPIEFGSRALNYFT